MFEKVPVEGTLGLYRDLSSGAVLNCSDMEFSQYLNAKQQKLNELEEIKKMKTQVNEIDNIKEELTELKTMMKLIINKLDSNS
jgi:hypothetical protein